MNEEERALLVAIGAMMLSAGEEPDHRGAALEAFDSLIDTRRHCCPKWDGLKIDETCPEFEACLCFKGRRI